MITKQATIKNNYGIHCRPSGVIAKAVKAYPGDITVTAPDGTTGNPKSVLSLLRLALTSGDTVSITVNGPDEEATCDILVELFERKFDFER